MKSLFWWLRHDRIGRSRLFVFAFAVIGVIGWVAFGWPAGGQALIVVLLSVILLVGDYVFWRRDLRKAGKPVPPAETDDLDQVRSRDS